MIQADYGRSLKTSLIEVTTHKSNNTHNLQYINSETMFSAVTISKKLCRISHSLSPHTYSAVIYIHAELYIIYPPSICYIIAIM